MNRSNFLSLEDRGELLACVKRQREDHGVARRANALLLLDDGKSCVEIAQVLYLDDDTVRGWHKQYVAEGWDAVAYDGWKGGQSRMPVAHRSLFARGLRNAFADLRWKYAPMSRRSSIFVILIQAVLSFWRA
jgi:hypothetical protein